MHRVSHVGGDPVQVSRATVVGEVGRGVGFVSEPLGVKHYESWDGGSPRRLKGSGDADSVDEWRQKAPPPCCYDA